MQSFRKTSEATQRFAERRAREDRAPRLATEIPDLVSLSIEVTESSTGISANQPKHVRRVVVEHAPALFIVACGDPHCMDGGHDVTLSIMRSLRSHETSFHGEDACNGSVGSTSCNRSIVYEGKATYRDPQAPR